MSDEKEKDPYSLKDIYSEMEMELIESFYRNFARHKIEERQRGFSWEMWQLAKLRNIQKYRRENRNIITKYIYKIKRVIESVLRSHFYDGRKNVESHAERISFPAEKKNVGLTGKEPPKETNFFGMNEKKLNALISVTKDDFENVQHAIYRKMDDVYRQTIFKTEFQLSSGSISLGKAIDKATEEFLDKGINCIIYKNGAHVNIASYAEMALRTASHRATLLGEGSKRDELGVHLVFVSAHANACKLCIPWQGQILIDDVFSHPSEEYIAKYKEKYKLLSVAIKSGLLHPNCRHTLATYFEGVTRLPEQQNPETALKNYENEQKQRQLEREVRLRKRIYAGTVDEQNKKEAKTKLLDAQKKLRDFLKEHPEFKRNQRREKEYIKHFEELTQKDKDAIIKAEIKKVLNKKKAGVHLKPLSIDTEKLIFDDEHINAERNHLISKEEAISYINKSLFSVSVWNGKYERYYSEQGAAYVDIEKNLIRTAFSAEEFDDITKEVIQVVKKYGKQR
jgi:hypothetical protein